MPYRKIIKDNETQFEVNPEKAPSFLQSSFVLLLAPVAVLWMVDSRIGIAATISLAIWMFFIRHNKNVTMHRKKISFTASLNGITINNTFYSRDNIHRMKIRNPVNKEYVMNTHNYAVPGAVAAGLGLREKLLNVSYRVDMEASGEAIVIAGGITEATAYAIVSDLNKIFEW